jgi:hypothetical protein
MARAYSGTMLAAAALILLAVEPRAQTVRIGLINSYTGFVAEPGDQAQKGIDLYVKEHEKDLPSGVRSSCCGATTPRGPISANGWRRN